MAIRAGIQPGDVVRSLLADKGAITAMGTLSLQGIGSTFSAASIGELTRARDDVDAVLRWATGFSEYSLENSPVRPFVEGMGAAQLISMERDLVNRTAIGVPMAVTFRRLLGSRVNEFVGWVFGGSSATRVVPQEGASTELPAA
jgi:hypothetical protein